MDNGEVLSKLNEVRSFMDRGEFEEALKLVRILQSSSIYGDNRHNVYVLLCDIGNALLDESLIKEAFDYLNKSPKKIKKDPHAWAKYSHLANVHYALFNVKNMKTPCYAYFSDTELDMAKKYYRLAIKKSDPSNSEHLLKMGVTCKVKCFSPLTHPAMFAQA